MCADRRITSDEGAYSSLVKIAKNEHLMAAASGNASCTLAVKRAVQRGCKTPAALVELVDKDSYALVLTADGRIVHIEDGQAWDKTYRGGVQAIGTGADLALGYLEDRGNISPSLLRKAQRFVAGRRIDCGGGCDIRSFE